MILNLTIFVFVITNLLIFFAVKTRTSIVISLLISCLVAILFFSQILLNYNSFKEIILVLVIYSMVILNLVISDTASQISAVKIEQKKIIWQSNHFFFKCATKFLILIFFLTIFFIIFLMVSKLSVIYDEVKLQKYNQQREIILNPIILPSHPVHQHVEKFYLKKNDNKNNEFYTQQIQWNENEFKKAQMKNELSDNLILKRSSEVLIIIAGLICLALINLSKTHNLPEKNHL
ncbi:hypothetical protein LBMAG18_07220 [Alphaproteobacteria bacterium]|nr:hypothetical protein LBMAG18_07220 [Alphaproteobacteria bacterium]